MSRKCSAIACVLLFVLSVWPLHSYATGLTLSNAPAQVYFSPNGGYTEAIIREIKGANLRASSVSCPCITSSGQVVNTTRPHSALGYKLPGPEAVMPNNGCLAGGLSLKAVQ